MANGTWVNWDWDQTKIVLLTDRLQWQWPITVAHNVVHTDPSIEYYRVRWAPEYCGHNQTRAMEKITTQVSCHIFSQIVSELWRQLPFWSSFHVFLSNQKLLHRQICCVSFSHWHNWHCIHSGPLPWLQVIRHLTCFGCSWWFWEDQKEEKLGPNIEDV